MPPLRRNLFKGDNRPGGIESYPLDELYKEVAFIAYYFHWDHDQVMQMPHAQRKQWCEEISKINRKLSEETRE